MVKDINGKKEFPLSDNKIGYIGWSVWREDHDDWRRAQEIERRSMQGWCWTCEESGRLAR